MFLGLAWGAVPSSRPEGFGSRRAEGLSRMAARAARPPPREWRVADAVRP
jgi:hypothetical protein